MDWRCASLQRPPARAPCASRLGLISLFSPYDRNIRCRDGFSVRCMLLGFLSSELPSAMRCDPSSISISIQLRPSASNPSQSSKHTGLLQSLFCIKQRRSVSQLPSPGLRPRVHFALSPCSYSHACPPLAQVPPPRLIRRHRLWRREPRLPQPRPARAAPGHPRWLRLQGRRPRRADAQPPYRPRPGRHGRPREGAVRCLYPRQRAVRSAPDQGGGTVSSPTSTPAHATDELLRSKPSSSRPPPPSTL